MVALISDEAGAEGAGAICVSVLISSAVRCEGSAACVISGRNVAPDAFRSVVMAH